MTHIKLDHINKKYGDVHVLKDINLEIQKGEFIVLVGPSGCGKSTLLRMIAGLEPISSGDMIFGDQRVNETPPRDRDIAMVFQSYALYPHMNVGRNLGFSLEINKSPLEEKEKRTRERFPNFRARPITGSLSAGAIWWTAPTCRYGPGYCT